ncbi:MAG: RibD family protein [Leptolyngbyaceae cyanobacterium bins.302]|nr:RibD family protein [Leptolyngbyaceae cyanobacterium bins.302]
MNRKKGDRPFTKVVLAMSADGKITDEARSPARFGSTADKRHLEEQIASCDAALFGATTLRVYGTTLPVTASDLLQQRQERRQSPQPIHIVCSASGDLDPNLRFFQQPVPRWLLTTSTGAQCWQGANAFERILIQDAAPSFDWAEVFAKLLGLGIDNLAILGGGELVASLLAAGCIDELYLTVCPLLLGGRTAPTIVEGCGFSEALAPRLELVSVRSIDQEVFLSYKVCPG